MLKSPGNGSNNLPSPYDLKRVQVNAGNQLARYLAMFELEEQYSREEGRQQEYYEAFANIALFLGDVKGAMVAYSKLEMPKGSVVGPLLENPLNGYHPVDAVEEIARKADSCNVIMIGEEHMNPQTRSLMVPVLRALRKKGFKYFAAETFVDDLSETRRLGYCLLQAMRSARRRSNPEIISNLSCDYIFVE